MLCHFTTIKFFKNNLIKKLSCLSTLSLCVFIAFIILYMHVYIFVYGLYISSLQYSKIDQFWIQGLVVIPSGLGTVPCKYGFNKYLVKNVLKGAITLFPKGFSCINSKEHFISVQLYSFSPILIVKSLVYYHLSLTPGASY